VRDYSEADYLRDALSATWATNADVSAYRILAEERHPDARINECGAPDPDSSHRWCRSGNHGGWRQHEFGTA
jgi:hypothetical protein